MSFASRVQRLPHLGIGVSTEYGATGAPGSLDPEALHAAAPHCARFLELGVETRKGLDDACTRWIRTGRPTTYHFLDINLDDPEDFDPGWLERLRELTSAASPAWLCGDAGLWHYGRREPAQMLLLPPILTDDSASELAAGIVRLREETGYEVLPENPPGTVYVGDLHLLDFFARVCERADTGMLLDCAHLAIYQRLLGHAPTAGLDGFPLDRIVEIHVAGAHERDHEGFAWIDDDHSLAVLPDTWAIVDRVAAAATELRAVVLECERNPLDEALAGFEALEARLSGSPFADRTLGGPPP